MQQQAPTFRQAKHADLPHIIDMLADDPLGAQREDNQRPILPAYEAAFTAIEKNPDNQLVVVEIEGQLVGIIQLTILPNLTHQGTSRALIEGVRIHSDYRSQGIGTKIFEWAITQAKQCGCSMVQLTSDKQRPEAIRFYERLGFTASHEGMKLAL